MMLQSRGQIVAGAILLCVALSSAEPLRINLNKRTLDAHALSAQHAALRQRFAVGAQNGGDDIPLLDFMDAQVRAIQRDATYITMDLAMCCVTFLSTDGRALWKDVCKICWA